MKLGSRLQAMHFSAARLYESTLFVRDYAAFQDFERYLLTVGENIGVGRHEWIDDLEAVHAAARRYSRPRKVRSPRPITRRVSAICG